MHTTLKKLSLSLFMLTLTALATELTVRIIAKDFSTGNQVNMALDLLRSALPATYDETLGWAPKPNFSGTKNAWNTQVTIAENGLRINREPWSTYANSNAPIVLAVGDSFTFGDQVSDHESWPSYLQDRLKTPVYNGGVFAYGLDQIYLRAKKLIPQIHPDILICSFIREDVFRNELIERLGVQKPYFLIDENEELQLKNIPVPPSNQSNRGWLRNIGGHSLAIHTFMSHFMRAYWLQGFAKETAIQYRGEDVACKLLKRFEALGKEHDMKIVLLLQYGFNQHDLPYATDLMARLKQCVNQDIVTIVDLAPVLSKQKADNLETYNAMFHVHMTPSGNALVADALTNALQDILKSYSR